MTKLPQTENPLLDSRFSYNKHNLRSELQAVNIAQVEKVFGKCKNSLRFGTDGISNHFLKIALPFIGESLCNIFNLSIATSVFLDCWKLARVAPIFKNGQSDDRPNYRPISVLPVFTMILEKLVSNQLCEKLDKNKPIHYKKSGFKSLHSAVTEIYR